MFKRFKNLAVGGLAALALSGCGSEEKIYTKQDFYNNTQISVNIHGQELYIRDLDEDGSADIMTFGSRVYWVSEDYGSKEISGFTQKDDTQVMTSEIRAAATRVLAEQRNLAWLMYRAQHQNNGMAK